MRHDLCFLLLAAAALVGGVTIGIVMGIAHDFTLSPVHAHLNLVGWTSLALFGLVYRTYPELNDGRAATLHLALCAPSAVALPAGIALAVLYDRPELAIGAALAWFGGCVVFLGRLIGLARSRRQAARMLPAE